jgi:hypothetical protein
MFAYPTARMPALVLALGLGFGIAVAVPVAPALAQQQPSAAAIAAAKELVTVKGANAMWQPLVRGVVERAKGVFIQSNPMLSKDLSDVANKLYAELNPRTAELTNDVAKLYATKFTEQELKDLLAFYKSSLGKKMLVEEPAILDQNMKNGGAWAEKLSEEVISKMRAEMRKRGHEM